MKLKADLSKARIVFQLTHNEEMLVFSATTYLRKTFESNPNIHDVLNRYWARMSKAQQDEIFSIYREVSEVFDSLDKSSVTAQQLTMLIGRLAVHHELSSLETYLALETGIFIPESCKESYLENLDDNNSREKTYTRHDYRKLLALTLFMQSISPIWGDYIDSIRQSAGADRKSYHAMQLLRETTVLESEAVKKLTSYINAITGDRHYSFGRILNGESSEDVGYSLLSDVCVRKLAVGDILGASEPKESNLVADVWKFLYQKVFNNTDGMNEPKAKDVSDNSGSTDSTTRSILESYKKRTNVSSGEVQELNFATRNIYELVSAVIPSVTPELVSLATLECSELYRERVGTPQLTISAWVLKDVVSPFTGLYVNRENVVNMVIATKIILWQRGHRYLSLLMSAYPVVGSEEMLIAPVDSRAQIPGEILDQLSFYFPYVWKTIKRRDNQITEETPPHIAAIEKVVDELIKNVWRSCASNEELIEYFGTPRRKFPVAATIKQDLALLLIDIEKQRKRTRT